MSAYACHVWRTCKKNTAIITVVAFVVKTVAFVVATLVVVLALVVGTTAGAEVVAAVVNRAHFPVIQTNLNAVNVSK